MTKQKSNGETVVIRKLLKVKVNLIKHIMEIRNTFNIGDTNVLLCICLRRAG